jgi:Uma2 family endonuclease
MTAELRKDQLKIAEVRHDIASMSTHWDALCDDLRFQDLPYKIELLPEGQILMTPHKPVHSGYQDELIVLLKRYLPQGRTTPELAIQTTDGIRVCDAAWMSHERWTRMRNESFAVLAPEICIEVSGASNARTQLLTKAELYFQAGAKEFWICTDGTMEFLPGPSQLAPDFPPRIDLE